MSVKMGGLLLGLFMLAILAYGLWYQNRHPRQIISTGQIRVEGKSRPGAPMTLETRRVRVGAVEFEEVRMPNGTWIDCAGDCRKAALEAGPDFWDALRDRSR
jgi:hypothetical protein